MPPELIVAQDLAGAAVGVFREVMPRSVALAGGSTPRGFYGLLATERYPWERVDFFFGDERCVPPEDPDSNLKMATEALLSKVPARVHPMHGCDPAAYEREMRAALGDRPALDLAILGLGEDGHTASLFPGDPALDEGDRWVVRVERPDHPRITLTLPVLSAARVALFLVTGAAKRGPLRRLMEDDRAIPAARVDAGRVVVVADPAAAR